MSDREQAIKDVEEFCEDDIPFVETYADGGNSGDAYGLAVEFAVSQRERVIALERALREPITDEEWGVCDVPAMQKLDNLHRQFANEIFKARVSSLNRESEASK